MEIVKPWNRVPTCASTFDAQSVTGKRKVCRRIEVTAEGNVSFICSLPKKISGSTRTVSVSIIVCGGTEFYLMFYFMPHLTFQNDTKNNFRLQFVFYFQILRFLCLISCATLTVYKRNINITNLYILPF